MTNTSQYPFLEDDFHIRWSTLTAENVEKDINRGIELAQEKLDAIRNLSADEVTFENTFLALETASEELGRGWGRLNHMDSVCSDDDLRAELNKMLPKVVEFSSSVSLDPKIWSALKAFRDSPSMQELNAVQQRFVTETCIEYVSSGADLPDDQKTRVAEIDAELSALTQTFSENVVYSTDAWELIIDDASSLKGLPEIAVEGARLDALEKGHGTEDEPKYRFTLQMPSMMPVMKFAEDDALRKKIWEGGNTIGNSGEWDNTEIIRKVLSLRHEKAGILGKNNFPEMILEHRMAKSGEAALEFTEKLHVKVEEEFLKDNADLKAFVANQEGTEERLLEPWEIAYWAEKRRLKEYDFDGELLRPYFSVESVMSGMFDIMSRIFGIRMEERDAVFGKDKEGAVQVWHEECKFYDVFDLDSGDKLGSFYADWHPREGKRGGAWMNSLSTGMPGVEDDQNLGLIIGNMTKPVGDTPALLNHGEVETIFHEFGHLLHHILGDVEIKSLSGTSVPWDFVELPSQILENYCWDRESLDLFAKHHETGESIPDELFDKMTAAKNYMSATHYMRQLSMGKLDLEIHIDPSICDGKTLEEVEKEVLAKYKTKLATDSPSVLRRFNHLFSGAVAYASGYYSYLWSEVLDADAFTRFKKEGILNPETGHAFRKEVLAVGNSRPADESYRAFMGRDPELSPLLERAGLE